MAQRTKSADLKVVQLDGRFSADQLHEEEIDLFSTGGNGIALGSSISSCDYCLQDSESPS
jgi:hypothetical protein